MLFNLFENWSPIRPDDGSWRHIWDSIRTNNVPEAIRFLDNGWDANRRERGWTALHVAARYGRRRIARVLLRRGANIDDPCDGWSSTPLHVATRYGHSAFVRCLLPNNANPNVYDGAGCSPLFFAIQNGDLEIISAIHGVMGDDLWNADRERFGVHPIHTAVEREQFDVLASLVQLGTFEVDGRTRRCLLFGIQQRQKELGRRRMGQNQSIGSL